MVTDTKVTNLVLNVLTQEQYDSAEKTANELYLIEGNLTAEEVGAVATDGSTPMTGDLKFEKTNNGSAFITKNHNESVDYGLLLIDADVDGNIARLQLSAINQTANIILGDNPYSILHTGNKPFDSYGGTGSATAQTVLENVTGNHAIISGNGKFVIVTANGGVCSDGTVLSTSEVKLSGGVLIVSSTNAALNASGPTYYCSAI